MNEIKLTKAQARALVAVRDGYVSQRYDAKGNTFIGPQGIGVRSYRGLEVLRLIEDVPGQTMGAGRPFMKQQLTFKGRTVLAEHGL